MLAASAALTDEQKAMAELFDNKMRSLGFSALFIAQSRGFTLDQFVHYDFLVNMAAFDGGIAAWNEKFRYDAVRPFSAIRHLYGDRRVTAWGGPGQGTVQIRASEWRSYLNTADHPEYPSGSACFCAAHSQASRRFLGSDAFGFSVAVPKGSSSIEPGITPANDIVLGPWKTFTEFEEDCGMSRFWGGVHFLASLDAGEQVCRPIGDTAYEFLKQHIDGRGALRRNTHARAVRLTDCQWRRVREDPPQQRLEAGDDLAFGEAPASIDRQTLAEALAIRGAGPLQQAGASQLAQRFGVLRVLRPEILDSTERLREDRLAIARTADLVQHPPENHSRKRQRARGVRWREPLEIRDGRRRLCNAVLTLVQSKQHVGTLRAHAEQPRRPVGGSAGSTELNASIARSIQATASR